MNQPQKDNTKEIRRAQLKHVLLDVNFKDKPKIIDLEDLHGPLARLLLMDILATCSGGTDAMISMGACRTLGRRIGLKTDQTEEIINYCITKEILLTSNGMVTNSRVIADQESLFKQQERWRNTKRNAEDSARIPRGRRRERVRKSEELNTEELKNEDLNIEEKKIVFPPSLDRPDVKKAWGEWLEHKVRIDKPYKTIESQQKKLQEWSNTSPELFIAAIDFSIGNEYQGIFEAKKENGHQPRKTNHERNKDIILKSYMEAKERDEGRDS